MLEGGTGRFVRLKPRRGSPGSVGRILWSGVGLWEFWWIFQVRHGLPAWCSTRGKGGNSCCHGNFGGNAGPSQFLHFSGQLLIHKDLKRKAKRNDQEGTLGTRGRVFFLFAGGNPSAPWWCERGGDWLRRDEAVFGAGARLRSAATRKSRCAFSPGRGNRKNDKRVMGDVNPTGLTLLRRRLAKDRLSRWLCKK